MFEKIASIILLNVLFYYKTIKFGYVSDDIASAQRPKEINKWLHAFWVLEGRLKSTPEIDHAITILLHALVCVGIFLGFGCNDVSFIAALLFAFNPINNQGAIWISGRGYVLSALGMVWALALPMEMGGLMLLGATYSNAGFIMPVVLVGSSHPELLIYIPLIWMFHMKRFRKNVVDKMNMEVFTEDRHIHPKKIILATKTFGFYLSHALIPIKTTFYHSLLESIAGSKSHRAYTYCRFFWIGAISVSVMAWYVLFHKWDMVCFGILWWCVGIAPFLNLYRMQQEIGERYTYLPNAGLMLVFAYVIHMFPFLVSGVLMMYATKMWFYMDGYREDFWLVEYARINSPDSWFAWHISALKRFEKQSYVEAIIFWVIAKQISPKEFKLLFNLATCLLLCNNRPEAMQMLGEAENNIPRGQEVMANKLIGDFKLALTGSQGKDTPTHMMSIILPATDLVKVNELVNEIESQFNNIQIVVSSNRQGLGKGWAVREGLKQCTGEFICFLDGDGDISPKMIKRLIPFIADYDIVCGVKPISGVWHRRIITYLSRIYLAILFGVKVDTQTGIKLFRRYAIHDWYNDNWLFDLEILADAKQRKLTMIEVPIEYTPANKPVQLISLWKTFRESVTLWLELK